MPRPIHPCRVTAYHPLSRQIVTSEATDPYSRCCTANGERTQIVDLASPDLAPPGWRDHAVPQLPQSRWPDISVYELHIRDFSASDASVPQQLRGTYLAFSPPHIKAANGGKLTAGLFHLSGLAAAGLTHVHLLPCYDFATVPERRSEQAPAPDPARLAALPPDSEEQQRAVGAVADRDAFNWGYDPVHYGVPEGSYATDPDGTARITEFRAMVQGLHSLGLKVVPDVVYSECLIGGVRMPLTPCSFASPACCAMLC